MMKTKFLLLSALAALSLAACQKDNDGLLRLYIEGMGSDSKMAAEGGASYWATGDKVDINGTEYTINVDESSNTATVDATGSTEYYGVYPSSIIDSRNGANHVLNLPSTYTYATTNHYGRTLQNVAAPMVGYAEYDENSSTSMQFKHVTAAIGVQVVNYYGFTVEVDSIIVTSNLYKLCGQTNITLGGSISVGAAEATENADKRVKIKFDGDASLHVFAGDSTVVQVPVLPVGASNKFTIDVYLHKVDQPAVVAHFNKEQSTAHSMDRSKIGYARTTFGGLFSVSASKKVVISQGNLQWTSTGIHDVVGGGTAAGTWRFALAQNEVISYVPADYNANTNGNYIDFFGWGTSGYHNPDDVSNTQYNPYTKESGIVNNTYNYNGYGPSTNMDDKNLTGTSANYDWGVYNAISNGGNVPGRWRTLTGNGDGSEWYYLFNSRTGTRYVNATVVEIKGLIIFPDNYTHPSDVTPLQGINSGSAWSDNIFNASNWNKMEANGAVFLPVTGNRTNRSEIVNYWSSSCYTFRYAYNLYGSKTRINIGKNQRSIGYAVRLVRDAE